MQWRYRSRNCNKILEFFWGVEKVQAHDMTELGMRPGRDGKAWGMRPLGLLRRMQFLVSSRSNTVQSFQTKYKKFQLLSTSNIGTLPYPSTTLSAPTIPLAGIPISQMLITKPGDTDLSAKRYLNIPNPGSRTYSWRSVRTPRHRMILP